MGARSFFEDLFEAGACLIGQGLRDAELRAAFLRQIEHRALELTEAVAHLASDGIRRLGLSEWPGARLGPAFAEFGRLGESDAAESVAAYLTFADPTKGDWLGGRLFGGRRLDGYLKGAESDPAYGVNVLIRNLRSELQRLRRSADPVGTALYDNIRAGGELLVDRGVAEAGRGDHLLFPGEGKLELTEQSTVVFEDVGAFAGFDAAVARDQDTADVVNEDGTATRHSPLRGAEIQDEMSGGIQAVATDASPAAEAAGDLHLGHLANHLRDRYPLPASFGVGSLPVDEDGAGLDLEDTGAHNPAAFLAAGPALLTEVFERARLALDDTPRLSAKRRGKLTEILDRMEVMAADSAGDLPPNGRATIREAMGIKPQTWSDDMKTVEALFAGARTGAGEA
ncbi:MAG: hypothetical protein P8R48_07705 [Planctomycetota bacterium]|nr:hypothetical protein [Planctomycetota bacterium]